MTSRYENYTSAEHARPATTPEPAGTRLNHKPATPKERNHENPAQLDRHQRWPIETGFAELKTALRGSGRALRGRTPELARQELWAYLAIYQAIRTLIARTAAGAGLDPGRISFTAARNAAGRTLHASPAALSQALDDAETEMLAVLVPLTEGRIWPRAVKKPSSPYRSRHGRPAPLAQHASYTVVITAPDPSAQTATDQPKQPAQHATSPP